MYSKFCREQGWDDTRLITSLLSSLANINMEINPAVKVSLDVFVCLWHKLGKHTSRKRITNFVLGEGQNLLLLCHCRQQGVKPVRNQASS